MNKTLSIVILICNFIIMLMIIFGGIALINNNEIRICCHCKKKAPIQRIEFILGKGLCKDCCIKFKIKWNDKF